MDYIIKEEIWRSIPVYFFSVLIFGVLNREGYIPTKSSTTFILAFLSTAAHFSIMVWYRKKEHLTNPSIYSILDNIFQSGK